MSPNFLGVLTRESFANWTSKDSAVHWWPDYPQFNDEYFEWIDVLESVASASECFTMVELGAGWGRWLVNAAVAARKAGNLKLELVGVEAEPRHFEFMKTHFRDNGLDPRGARLVRAAVAAQDGHLWFRTGRTHTTGSSEPWYGQSIASGPPPAGSGVSGWLQRQWHDLSGTASDWESEMRRVPAVSLATLLRPLAHVDVIHMDVQGSEFEVLQAATEHLAKVKRIHIGTHSAENEVGLRLLFGGLGWTVHSDYPLQTECGTPWGKVRFGDGIQTWLNPRLQ